MLKSGFPIRIGVALPVAALMGVATAHAEAPPIPVTDQAIQPPQRTDAAVTTAPPANPLASAVPAPAPAPPDVPPAAPGADQSDIIVTARPHSAADPLQHLNAKSFEATQSVDRAVVGPVALAYEHKVPGPIRIGLRNVLKNLHEPDVFLNFLLQHKVGKAAETFGRFAINSTIGVAGLFDVAKRRPFNLPRRPNGLANTLGFYGVKPGPFFFLPLVGPTTLRDLIGNGIDGLLLPTAIGKPFSGLTYTVPTGALRSLDHRASFDEQLNKLRDDSPDPYVAAREYYLQQRQAEIDDLHGRHPIATPAAAAEMPEPAVKGDGPPL